MTDIGNNYAGIAVSWQERYLERFYRQRPGWIDGTTEFHELCAERIETETSVLEIGAGPSNSTSAFLANLGGELHGVDIDPDVERNEALASATVTKDCTLPFSDGSFKACVSNYVAEHIQDPEVHLEEVARVLAPGGVYIFRAPNVYHYIAVVSRLTPHWFHEAVANKLRGLSKESHAPYPTYYRMNSASQIHRLAKGAGLEVDEIRLIEKEPSYGCAAKPLFLLLMLYERLVNSTERLGFLRANLLVTLRKGAPSSSLPDKDGPPTN